MAERISNNGVALRQHDDSVIHVRSVSELESLMANISPIDTNVSNVSSGSDEYIVSGPKDNSVEQGSEQISCYHYQKTEISTKGKEC